MSEEKSHLVSRKIDELQKLLDLIQHTAFHAGYNVRVVEDDAESLGVKQKNIEYAITVGHIRDDGSGLKADNDIKGLEKYGFNTDKFKQKFIEALKASGINEPKIFTTTEKRGEMPSFLFDKEDLTALNTKTLRNHLEKTTIPELKQELGNIPAIFCNKILTSKYGVNIAEDIDIPGFGMNGKDIEDALLTIANMNKIKLSDLAKRQTTETGSFAEKTSKNKDRKLRGL